MQSKKFKIVLLFLLVLLLACVRGFENQLFSDPFLNYFKENSTTMPLPSFDFFRLFIVLLLRYTLNTIFSLGIIYVLFKEIKMVKFASVLYVFFFILLISGFFLAIYIFDNHNSLLLFYIRRFIIQPIFLLLFVPAFYYQKLIENK
jgi:exosortase F-associated protein